jgi:tetratricopeptide (TPR) repeat protein
MGAETAEIKVDKKVDLLSIKDDMERIGKSENGISDEEFLEKHKEGLKTDIKAFTEVLANSDKRKFKNILIGIADIGMSYLKKPNANIFALQIIDALNKPIKNLHDEKKDLIIDATGKTKEVQTYPVTQIESLNDLFIKASDKVNEPVKSGMELDDSSFLDIADKLGSELDLARESALRMIFSSKEKPFENIVIFKKIAKVAIESYPMHQNNDVIRLVLRRGAKIMKEDEQAKKEIDRSLEDSEFGKMQKDIKDTLIEANKLVKAGEYEKALKKIVNTLKLDMTNPEANALFAICKETITNKGFLLMKEGKYDEAMDNFCLVLKYVPNDTRAIAFAAKCEYKRQDSLKKEGPPRPGEKGQKLTEAERDDLVNKGVELLGTNKFREARIVFLNLNEFNPGNPMVIQALCTCSEGLANQEIAEASKTYQDIISSDKWKEPAEMTDLLGNKITILVETQEGRRKMKSEIIRKVLPHLTDQVTYAKEAISYKRQLIKTKIGKELTSEDEIRAYGWQSFMVADAKMKEYTTKDPDVLKGKEELAVLSNFNRETADMISNTYPPRFSSLWDLYKVHYNEDKKDIMENKDGLPVMRNKNERYMCGVEKQNPLDDFEYVMNSTRNEKLRKAAGKIIEAVNKMTDLAENRKGKTVYLGQDLVEALSKASFEFKKEASKVILDDSESKELRESAESCLLFCNDRNTLIQLAMNAPSKEEAKKAKGNLPESEAGKDYIDPETELTAYMVALDRYLDAIRLDPTNKKNYEALWYFLGKMDLGELRKAKSQSANKEAQPGLGEIPSDIEAHFNFEGNYDENTYKKLAEDLTKTIKNAIQKEISPIINGVTYIGITLPLIGLPIAIYTVPNVVENPEYETKKEPAGSPKGERVFHPTITLQRPYLSWAMLSNRSLVPPDVYITPPGGEEALMAGPDGQVDTSGIMISISAPPEEILEFIMSKLR